MANVIHGKSQKEQGKWFREVADGWKRRGGNTKYGKGSNRRQENIKAVLDNWDEINWGR